MLEIKETYANMKN